VAVDSEGSFSRDQIITGELAESSCAAGTLGWVAGCLGHASGHAFMPGLLQPTAEFIVQRECWRGVLLLWAALGEGGCLRGLCCFGVCGELASFARAPWQLLFDGVPGGCSRMSYVSRMLSRAVLHCTALSPL
jgi:hypothetical protein